VADEAKIGTVWSDEELDLIVADYFAAPPIESMPLPSPSFVRAAVKPAPVRVSVRR
jgi:hypothetical protein